ncbi:IS110 family transposase [Paeniglutamicibacter psychrophenolicus]|uniref:IS110 family transposase n=1 Tax=Paeniglutamicibacter psychrophenolicus TaxID=257454 RepID=UPI002786B95C|nr:IS110 family transposase [Paeniglutamicibacter psychrophenolicus]MDQ0094661.1 transposase/DNA-binding XRE family transcriptional regulator [Paeniglutamicibacter psychrophenolicus]
MTNAQFKVIAGIDTHADTHHVALVTDYGKRLGDRKFLAVGSGYQEIAAYLTSFGPVTAVGVEGTGSYGAELTRVLTGRGFTVREVNRPNRAERRLHGKSDPLDAYQAAESVLAERGTSTPKTRDGHVEALRVLRTARTSAMKARTALLNQISGVLTSAAEEVRAKYRGMSSVARAKAMATSRPGGDAADPVVATLVTLKRLGTRHRFLSEEIAETDAELAAIVSSRAPELLEVNGVGTVVASQLLVTFGDNPERMGSEAAFAALAGVAPVPASSGKTNRHRLSRGGDRQANASLYRIVLVRMAKDARTREYVAKRTEDGMGKKEIIRCLKRYVAREIFRVMKNPRPAPLVNDLRPLRLGLGLTQVVAANALGCWTSTISRIERGECRDHEAIERYRSWLEKQGSESS